MKIGLEIHQRLDTHKLFCKCPCLAAEGQEPELVLKRKLHPVFSELGELDHASQAEFSKDRTFYYQAWGSSDCLVETDEEPPHDMNTDALFIVLEIAMQLNARPVDEVHVMRKMVIDGSNTSGFQRSAVIALDGSIETSKGKIGIPLIALEEESAGIVQAGDREATYRLDRLGISLIEISTTPDIRDGQHLYEVAERLGMLLRATGKVARGLGTIRQDVNISTEGGARVEIKGVQELALLPAFVANEVKRQEALLKLIGEVKKRFGSQPAFARSFTDVSSTFANTNSQLLKQALGRGEAVFAVLLPGHAGLLGTELQPGRRYGSELSDYAKHAGVKGIIHSDENLAVYHISESELAAVSSMLGAEKEDAFVLVVAPSGVARDALVRVLARAEMMFVPEETRKANQDGSSSYMRPLPGRARMYPETDVVPVPITEKLLNEVRKKAGSSLEDKRRVLSGQLNSDMAGQMLRSRHLGLYERLVRMGVEPVLAANTLLNTLISLRREGAEVKEPEKLLPGLFSEYLKGPFTRAAIPEILKWHAKEGKAIQAIVQERQLSKITGTEAERIARENDYDMKKIMAIYRFRVEPAEMQTLVSRLRK